MNPIEGSLCLVGLVFMIVGIVAKLTGVSFFAPVLTSALSYFIAANTCFLLCLVMGRFQK